MADLAPCQYERGRGQLRRGLEEERWRKRNLK
jgi:hypothetical protein